MLKIGFQSTQRLRSRFVPSRRKKVALILVELGSEWPSWLNQKLGESLRRVVCQQEGETPSEFGNRVLALLEAERISLLGVTLLCNARSDSQQAGARTELARALRTSLGSEAEELFFAAPGHAQPALSAVAC